jgi:hypothetical protein
MTPPTQEKTMEWETKVWTWITKEMPYKHSDRFAPLFKTIDEIRQEAYEQGYQTARDRYRQREVLSVSQEK